jgi:hypothetical protein
MALHPPVGGWMCCKPYTTVDTYMFHTLWAQMCQYTPGQNTGLALSHCAQPSNALSFMLYTSSPLWPPFPFMLYNSSASRLQRDTTFLPSPFKLFAKKGGRGDQDFLQMGQTPYATHWTAVRHDYIPCSAMPPIDRDPQMYPGIWAVNL